ncbi:MAG: prenyltransferase/squalene oxidase repeat-containing protein [Candidatus Bathyarchaeia archaeon]
MLKDEVKSSIEKGANWVFKIRNPDFGWGDIVGRHSDPMDTSELLFGLLKAKYDPEHPRIKESIKFVIEKIKGKYETLTKAPRNLMWPILMLVEAKESLEFLELKTLFSEVREKYEVKDGSWAFEADGEGNVYDTSMVIRAMLRMYKKRIEEKNKAIAWLKFIQNDDGGWGFYKKERTEVLPTSMAVIALVESGEPIDSLIIQKAIKIIQERRNVEGGWDATWEFSKKYTFDKFMHFTSPWALTALLITDVNPKSEIIQNAVKFILKQQDESGGWKVFKGLPAFSWGTGNALAALGEYLERID